jgi:large subunit ribosomal protein L23
MQTSSVIIAPVVTEKAERLKATGTYVVKVHKDATKVEVKNAFRKYFDVEVASIRVLRTVPKRRIIGQGTVMEKRHRSKRMIVRLAKGSKALDFTSFRTAA